MPGNSSSDEVSALEARIDALLADAEAGGAFALQAARQAAVLSDPIDPSRFHRALSLAAKLDPLNAAPRLALSRRLAERGDIEGARREAALVFAESVDEAARAHAAYVLGEIARALGDGKEARTRFETVAKIENKLLAANQNDRNASQWYARAIGRIAELDSAQGKPLEARRGAEGALSILRALATQEEPPLLAADVADAEMRLGAMDLDAGKPADAQQHFGQAIGRYEALILQESDEPHWRAVLADCWVLAAEADLTRGGTAQAREAIDRALQLRVTLAARDDAERWALAATWRQRAALYGALGDTQKAAESLNQARALAEKLVAETGSEPAARFLVHTLLDQVDHARRTGSLVEAKAAALEARRRAEPYAQSPRTAPAWRADLAAAWDRIGDIARAGRALGHASDAYARSVELRRLVREADSDAPYAARGLAVSLLKAGDCALDAREPKTARAAFAESFNLRLLLAENATSPATTRDLAVTLERIGHAALADGDVQAARVAWEDELALAEQIYADDISTEGQRFRAIVEANLAGLAGPKKDTYRAAALRRFDLLARDGQLSPQEDKLRRSLWGN